MSIIPTSNIENKYKKLKRRSNYQHNNQFRLPKMDGRSGKLPPLDGNINSTFDERKRSLGSLD